VPDEEIRRIKVERLMPGDIILTASSGKVSNAIRIASKGQVSHAMICVQHGSIIDSTDDGVQAHNIQRELYEPDDHVAVLRLRHSLSEVQLGAVIDFARSEIGTRYSKERSRAIGPDRTQAKDVAALLLAPCRARFRQCGRPPRSRP
jgi:uncharacterized protein YycO